MKETLKLALEALKHNQHLIADNERHAYVMEYNSIIEKCEEALAQPEQEPVAWEHFYLDIGKPQIEQPKVRTGDRLLVGVCASEGHKIQKAQSEQEEYLSKAYRMANELRCHLAIAPAPQRTWVGLTDEQVYEIGFDLNIGGIQTMKAYKAIESKLKENCGG